jgi:hypothetical protein
MVIKIDAGIESALALDDELVVATRKPAAIQCIRWTPDSTGNQTRTEIIRELRTPIMRTPSACSKATVSIFRNLQRRVPSRLS